jgi:hypothetical protein
MKSYIIYIFLLVSFASCQKRALCPAYMDRSRGTISKQDTETLSPQEARDQSLKLLDAQDSYIQVKRDKTTGLVIGKRRVKKGKNNTLTDRNFSQDSRTGVTGVKLQQKKPKLNSSKETTTK